MLIAGIDEAGRGCVIGPLVVAGVLAKEENLNAFSALGVKDSKLLTAKKREAIATDILSLAERYAIIKVSPEEIDHVVESHRRLHKLNRLEAETMAKIITILKPDVCYVDAADVLEHRFGQHVLEASEFKTHIISEHKADRIYPIVSAASIVAKIERDNEVAALRRQHGDFGTGYLTDPKTTVFLSEWLEKHQEYPNFVRKSWKPAKQIKSQRGTTQKKLF